MTEANPKGTERVGVLLATKREVAVHELNVFAALCKQEGLGQATLEWDTFHDRHPDERATFLLELPGLRLLLVDDPILPAMFVTFSGDEAILQRADPLLDQAFRFAHPDGLLQMAEEMWQDEPSALVLAALAPSNPGRLERVIAEAITSKKRGAREAAAKAAAMLGTPPARALLEQAHGRETHASLKKELGVALAQWGSGATRPAAPKKTAPEKAAPKKAKPPKKAKAAPRKR